MKRLLLGTVVMSVVWQLTGLSFGAADTCTASAIAATWSTAAAWSCSGGDNVGPPDADDAVIVPYNREIRCDGTEAAPCTARQLDVEGLLYDLGDAWYLLGEGGSATTSTHSVELDSSAGTAGPTWIIGPGSTVEISCDATTSGDTSSNENCRIAVEDRAQLTLAGGVVGTGRVTSVTEDCPLGDWKTTETDPGDCANAITIGVNFTPDSSLVGRVLVFDFPSQKRHMWYDIIAVDGPGGTINLDYNSRGQMEPHGLLADGTATVAAGPGDTVVWDTGVPASVGSDWQVRHCTDDWTTTCTTDGNCSALCAQPLYGWFSGGYFFCDADVTELTNADPVNHDQWLPNAAATRIDYPICVGGTNDGKNCYLYTCSTGGGTCTGLKLTENYNGSSCISGADGTGPAHIAGEAGRVPGSLRSPYVERIQAGDGFRIIAPATITIPAAKRQVTTEWIGPASDATLDADDNQYNYYIDVIDDGSVTLRNASLQFLGYNDDAATNVEALDWTPLTSGNTLGRLEMDTVEFAWTQGSNRLTFKHIVGDKDYRGLYARNAQQTDNTGGHFLRWEDATADAGDDFTLKGVRCHAMADDCLVNGSGGATAGWLQDEYAAVTIEDVYCSYSSTVQYFETTSCTQLRFSEGTSGNAIIRDLVSNAMDDGNETWESLAAASGDTWPGVLQENIVCTNSTGACVGGRTGGATLAEMPWSAVNVVAFNMFHDPTSGATRLVTARGSIGSSYLQGGIRQIGGMNNVLGVIAQGQALMEDNAYSQGGAYEMDDSAVGADTMGSAALVQDSVFFDVFQNQAAPLLKYPRSGVSGFPDLTTNHNTFLGVNDFQTTNHKTTFIQSINSGDALVVTHTNNFFMNASTAMNHLGSNTTWNESNNLMMHFNPPSYTGFTLDGTSKDLFSGNAPASIGAAGFGGFQFEWGSASYPALTFTTTTGDPVGARCAGPTNWPYLEKIAGATGIRNLNRPTVNVDGVSCVDTDGDGWRDLHDNCDGTYNPLQLTAESCE